MKIWRSRLERMRANGAARSGTVKRVIENAGWLLAGKGVGAVLSLVYLGLATRSLGPDLFGQFALILGTAQAIAAFVGFQTWQLVVRYGMAHLQQGRTDALGRVVAFAYALDYGGALVGCLIAWGGVHLLGGHFGWSAALHREALLFAFVLLLSVRSTSVGILRLHDRFGTGAVADAVTPVVRLGGALIAVLTGATVTGFLIAWAASEVATAAAYRYFAAKVSGGRLQWPRLSTLRAAAADNPGLLRFAFVTNASSTLASLGKQLATLLVGLFAGTVAAGHYRLAYQLGQSLAKVSDMLSRSVYAELTRVHFGDARENVAKLFRGSVRLSLIAGAVIVALLLLAGKPVIALVAGPAYVAAYPLLLLLGIAAAIELGGVSFEPALVATGRAGLALKLRFVSSGLFLALLAVLLPAVGATGAALASLAAALTSLLLFGAAAWRAVHR